MRLITINVVYVLFFLPLTIKAQEFRVQILNEKRGVEITVENMTDSCLFLFDKQFENLRYENYEYYSKAYDERIYTNDTLLIVDLSDSLFLSSYFHKRVNRLLTYERWTSKCIEPHEIVRYHLELPPNKKNQKAIIVILLINNKKYEFNALDKGSLIPKPR